MLNHIFRDDKEDFHGRPTNVSQSARSKHAVTPERSLADGKHSMSDLGLWDFSVRFYERDGIAALCLAWQDEYGVDVTVLLLAAWAASRRQELSVGDLSLAEEEIAPWRNEIVEPLRTMRRRLKRDPSPAAPAEIVGVRNLIKSAELEAERVALAVLERHRPRNERTEARTVGQIATTNIANVRKYFSAIPASDSADSQHFVDAIVDFQSKTT
jgi:uncharacterized protein (TIGR02444 family)